MQYHRACNFGRIASHKQDFLSLCKTVNRSTRSGNASSHAQRLYVVHVRPSSQYAFTEFVSCIDYVLYRDKGTHVYSHMSVQFYGFRDITIFQHQSELPRRFHILMSRLLLWRGLWSTIGIRTARNFTLSPTTRCHQQSTNSTYVITW